MDVREYCDNLAMQLTVWKQELFEVAVTAEHFHSESKEVIGPELKKLMQLIDEIGGKIDRFKETCELPESGVRKRAGAAK
jgi:hypothetical protein